MNKITYVNPLGGEVEFSATSKYKWQSFDDLVGTEVLNQVASSPYQDGVTAVGDSYFQSKTMKLDFVCISDTLESDLRELYSALNPKLGLGRIDITIGETVYSWNSVKIRSLPSRPGAINKLGSRFQFSQVIFEIFDPLFADFSYTESYTYTGVNLLEFDLDITDEFEFDTRVASGVTVANGGDVPCPIEVEFSGPSTSPLTLENVTTGEKIVVILDLTSDEKLYIYTKLEEINVVKETISTGEKVTAFQYVDVDDTDFFYLSTGDNNLLLTAGEGIVYGATVKFKQRYIGI